jgi:hypothetical protein
MSRRGSHSSDEGLWGSLEGTPLETTDLTFPSMALPPRRFRINNREALEHYLRQSPLLFEAYSEELVSNVFEGDDSDDFQLLRQWSEYDVNEYESFNDVFNNAFPAIQRPLRGFLFTLFMGEDADLIGIMFLNEVFKGWMAIRPDSNDARSEVKIFIEVVKGLKAKERPAPVPRAVFAQGLDAAFGAVFMDPHDMVSYYAHELQRLWKAWHENPTQYIAPYTSIVTSSMMGKSRLMKEMASFMPTIYICLRETGESGQQVEGERFVDAYPERSPDKVINYLFYEPQPAGSPRDMNRHYVCFFIGVLEAMAFWIASVISESSPGDESVVDINKRLWRMLAEPSTVRRQETVTDWSTKFWVIAINRARKLYANEDSRSLQNLVRSNWRNLKTFLKGLNMLGEDNVPLLLFVFDEARPLVKLGPNGKILHDDEEISRFRLLRRALQEVAMSSFEQEDGSGNTNEPIGIFTIFTDTTSKITNFQPGRKASRKQTNDLFPPIVILPTFDYHAKYRLQITNDPTEVAKPGRLFHFGRAAWYSMLLSGTPYKTLVHLAAAKLTRKDASSLSTFFENDPLDEESRLVMLALMGPRLALQTGSFTALLPEMVSSHLMILMRVSDDHEQLEAFYASEPILAEASSSITAVYGWERPCQAMVALFRHGMVDKGFRGEFVTKGLCCIAFEDACREMNEKADQGEVKEELDYSKAVPVFSFLDRLLHNPDSELPTELPTDSDDDDGDDGIGGGRTPIPPESRSGIKEPKKRRLNRPDKRGLSDIPEVDETDQIVQPDSSTTSKRKRDDISEDSTEETKTRKKSRKKQPKKQPKKQTKKAGSTKRRKPTYDNPTEEPAYDFFDDWDSDEEDYPYIRGKDKIPVRDESKGLYEYVLHTLSDWNDTRPQTKLATQTSTDSGLSGYDEALEDLNVLKNGTVFVTHFVAITTKLRPSILVKAWNRGAGIMTKANTEGIDFVIPVMLDRECEGFGPLYGPWTVEQELAASRAVGYILIDAKNDASLSDNDITNQAMKCVPSGANIRFHEPMNPFITIIASYGSSDPKMPVKLVRDATIDTQPTQFAFNAQGLSGATFKCLEDRPNLTRILKTILEMDRNPLRGSGRDYEGVRKTTREFHPLALHPGREDDLLGLLGDDE